MYNFKKTTVTTEEQLLKFIEEEEIILHYYGTLKRNTLLPCPFKLEKTPSFYISYLEGRIKWRRFGIVERPQSPIELVMRLYNIPKQVAIQKIFKELVLVSRPNRDVEITKLRAGYTDEISFSVEYDNLKDFELLYFQNYNIQKESLEYFEVYGCRRAMINGYLFCKSKASDPAFIYLNGPESWSVYRPLSDPSLRHRKYNIRNHLMGYSQLPDQGEILIITKSMKDILVFNELDYPAISPHSERIYINQQVLEGLKNRFERIIVCYDNDDTGIQASIKFTQENNLEYWNVPKDIGCKDPADVSKKYGLDYLKALIDGRIRKNT